MLFGLLLIGSTTIGFSQENINFGVKAGLNLSSLIGEYPPALTHKSKLGFHLGGTAEYELSDKFSLLGELLISTQGGVSEFRIDYNNPSMGNYYETQTQTLNLTNLNLPILIKYHITEKLSIEAGPQIGYVVSAKNKLEYVDSSDPSNNETIEFDALKDGTFTFGGETYSYKKAVNSIDISVNLGATYDINDKIYVQGRYNRGLSNVDTNSTAGSSTASWDMKNSVFQISAGYRF